MSTVLQPNPYGVIPLQPKPGGNVDNKPLSIEELGFRVDPDVKAALRDYGDFVFIPETMLPPNAAVIAAFTRTPEGWLMIGLPRSGYPCDVNSSWDCETYGYFIPHVTGDTYFTAITPDYRELFFKLKGVVDTGNYKRAEDVEPLGPPHDWAFIGEPGRDDIPRLALIPGAAIAAATIARWLIIGAGIVAALKITEAIYNWSQAMRITAEQMRQLNAEVVKLLDEIAERVENGEMSPAEAAQIVQQMMDYLNAQTVNAQKGDSIVDKIESGLENVFGGIATFMKEALKMIMIVEVIRTLLRR